MKTCSLYRSKIDEKVFVN